MIILDIECYKDYFLLMIKEVGTDRTRHFELTPEQPLNIKQVSKIMEKKTTISFNGISYDLPIIQAALEGRPNRQLKRVSDRIINSGKPSWMVHKEEGIQVPYNWNHIDLINVAPGIASLKLYGARLKAPKIQDLPISPGTSIHPDQYKEMRQYCLNDLETTELLYKQLMPQISLRESMGEQYNLDLRSKSDAQIAEAVIKSELQRKTGRRFYKPKEQKDRKVKYKNPGIVSFKDPKLTEIFKKIMQHEFGFKGNGSIILPKWLKDEVIVIGKAEYNIGIGGLHSREKCQLVEAGEGILCDWDVTSYYPSIILQQKLAPKAMGQPFLDLYKSIVERRIEAKANGDKVVAGTLKIVLNGSFGKLGSKYSALYAPELLLQVTITGQLSLLMLIERMEAVGIRIMSANTDGIVCKCEKGLEGVMERVAWEWELDTSYVLERENYKLVASRDVNSYFAIKTNGKVKRKGIFNVGGLMKNPDRAIIYDAVVESLANGVPLRETVEGCTDISKFVTARKVTGGALWNGEDLGKAIRYYVSNKAGDIDPFIRYKVNGNKVPKSDGCRPLMKMGEGFPNDIDYSAYLRDAEKLLKEVGYVQT